MRPVGRSFFRYYLRPELSYEDVDIQYIKPRPRRYDVSKGEGATAVTAPRSPEAASAVATATSGANGHSGDGAKAAGASVAQVERK